MLSHIIDVLAYPNDGSSLTGSDDFTRLVSVSGHSFDVAKQGYVTLSLSVRVALADGALSTKDREAQESAL